MQPGKVETTGKNVGGLIGFMHSYNRLNSAYIHYTYSILQNSFATGEVTGNANVGGLVGYGYRQNTYNHTYQNAYLQISNCYAIGKVTSQGEAGGLIGQLASTYNGSTTTTDSYWTPETTMQQESKAGSKRSIQAMLYPTAYASTYDFYSIWNIRDGYTLGYLANVDIPEAVNSENISYQAYQVQGRGTEISPYLIKNAIQLQKLDENLTAYYKLVNDIDLSGVQWNSIGNDKYKFIGTLDGNGFTIRNLNLQSEETNQGLFGYNAGTIKNVILESATVEGTSNLGALVGYNEGTITNCNVITTNVTGTSNVGALVGYNTGIISSSTSNGTIQGTDNTGGLIGFTTGNVTASSSEASVTGNNQVGGLIGYAYTNNKDLTIETSASTGTVNGTANVGGLIGYEYVYHTDGAASKTYSIYLKKSYSTGNVTGTGNNIGGLVGYQRASIYTNNHYEYSYNYIQECYASGNVQTTGENAGGLIGLMHAYNLNSNTYIHYSYVVVQNSYASR